MFRYCGLVETLSFRMFNLDENECASYLRFEFERDANILFSMLLASDMEWFDCILGVRKLVVDLARNLNAMHLGSSETRRWRRFYLLLSAASAASHPRTAGSSV